MFFNKKPKLKIVNTIDFPTMYGNFDLTTFETNYKDQPNMKFVFVVSSKTINENPIVRIHSECILSEVFKSTHCDCREQLELGLEMVAKNNGVLFYLNQEGRGHGLFQKVRELKKQEEGMDTVEASEYYHLEVDARRYDVVADILKLMNIAKVQLITNNPRKIKGLEGKGVVVEKRINAEIAPNSHNKKYLQTKKSKLGHLLDQYI